MAAVIFEQPAHFSVESPIGKAFLSTIQADLPGTPLFYNASCLDVIIPGVFRVAVDHAGVRLDLKISSGVFDIWRAMCFGWRPGPDKPKGQMFKDVGSVSYIF